MEPIAREEELIWRMWLLVDFRDPQGQPYSHMHMDNAKWTQGYNKIMIITIIMINNNIKQKLQLKGNGLLCPGGGRKGIVCCR